MANEFFTILTATGRNKLANATATGTPLTLTQMAVGDGDNGAYYSPTEVQTALKHEVWRGAINHLAVDASNPNWIVAELVIPDDVGGWYVREVGLFDSAGALIAVGKFPESYKPTLAAGSNKQLYVRMILEVTNTSAVTLLVDPSVVLATRQYVDDKVAGEINKLDGKQSVRVATTAAIALAGLQTIDGVALAAGDRVLVKDQAAGATNGIYVVTAAAWMRATDADANIELTPGMAISVEQGTAHADSVWMLVTDSPIVLGTTPLVFDWIGRRGLAPLVSPIFLGTPRGPTPDQFDNSTRLATMEAVQRALGSFAGSRAVALSGNVTLTAADAGTRLELGLGAAVKFPLCSSCPFGTAFFISTSPAVNNATVIAQGADSFAFNNSGAHTNYTMGQGTDVIFVNDGTVWRGHFGSETLRSSSLFANSLAGNGYQKLPSGLIVQWGSVVTNASGGAGTYSFPLTFPNAVLSTVCTSTNIGAGGTTSDVTAIVNQGNSQFICYAFASTSGAQVSRVVRWIAIGY